jgi:hypothetical protein
MRLSFFSTDPCCGCSELRHRHASRFEARFGLSGPLTVFRKLKELGYRTSYSHRGRFYTLDRIARFDRQGLWSPRFGLVLILLSWNPGGYRRSLRQPFSCRPFRCQTGGRAARVRAGPPATSGGPAAHRSATRVWLVLVPARRIRLPVSANCKPDRQAFPRRPCPTA